MWRKILREVVIFYLCLAIFPVAVILYVIQGDSLSAGAIIFSRGLLYWGASSTGPSWAVLIGFITPYLIVQCIRGYRWSARSVTGKKWTNLYFSFLAICASAWGFWHAWDLFYFMYALGDMPGELAQFLSLEWGSVLILALSAPIGIRCLRIFLDPSVERSE